MEVINKRRNKFNPCDDILIDYIDSFGSNIANLRKDIRDIVREEIQIEFSKLVRELRKPKPYIERGYRG